MLTAAIIEQWHRMRAALIAEFPELADDSQALADTLDGEAEAKDIIAKLIRESRVDFAMVDGLSEIIGENRERRDRVERRALRQRQAAQELLEAIGERKIERPDFTASIGASRASVRITDEAALPDELCRIETTRTPDKAAIQSALANGPVPGAVLSNGGTQLTIRTR